MSLLDKASLVVTPNAYKESKLYSVIPNTTLGDMDVVRATTATRINSAGLVEELPRNILTYSEQFDNADWNKINATITANTTVAPNGTTTADTLVITSGGYLVRPIISYSAVTGQKVTASIFTKNQITDFLQFGGATPAGTDVYSIETISNGWYRHKVTRTFTTTAVGTLQFIIYDRVGANFIWGAQLELGSILTEYFPTTTRLNIPRIDYTNGSCPSLLVEPQRTNLQLNSEDFSNASWVKTLSAVVANQIASPSGNVDADKLNETATTGNHQLESSRNASIAAYSMSVFAKKSEREWLYLFEDTTGKGAYFNLNNGTIGTIAAGATAKIESFGNGWYRCSVTYNESGTFGRYRIAVTTGNGVTSYTGVANNGIYIWGAQYELGAYSTSYIPTTASSVTRNMDVISKTGISSLIGQTEGTVFVDINVDLSYTQTDMRFINISDGTSTNWWFIGTNVSNQIRFYYKTGATTYVSQLITLTSGRHKLAFAYKSNDYVAYVDGTQVHSLTSLIVGATSQIDLGNNFGGSGVSKQFINSAQLYKTRLTNAEIASLTTL